MVLAQSYLLKRCLKALLIATPGFCGPILLAHSGPLFDALSRELIGFFELLFMMLLLVPMVAYLSMPAVAAIAVGFSYFIALSDRELVVMQASRLSIGQLVAPGVMAAGAAALLCAAASLFALPESARILAERIFVAEKNIRPASLRENRFAQLSPGVEVYFHSRLSPDAMRHVIVRVQDGDNTRAITAETATFIRADARLFLVFENGFVTGSPSATPDVGSAGPTRFAQYRYEIARLYTLDDVHERFWGFYERHIQHLLFPPAGVTGPERAAWLIEGLKRLIHPMLSLAYGLLALAIVFSLTTVGRRNVIAVGGGGILFFGGLHTAYLIAMGILSREPDFAHRIVLLFPLAIAVLAYVHLHGLDRQRTPRASQRFGWGAREAG